MAAGGLERRDGKRHLAGLRAGDDVAIEAEGPDRIVVRRASRELDEAFGVFDGLYENGYLERLRSEERA